MNPTRPIAQSCVREHIVFPLADLVATRPVKLGDFIRIDRDSGGRMTFVKKADGALVSVLAVQAGGELACRGRHGEQSKCGGFTLEVI